MIIAVILLALAPGLAGRGIDNRLFGGRQARRTENRFTVWIEKNGFPSYSCGGSLIEEDWVVTAASCFEGDQLLKTYKIIAGDFILNREDGEVVIQPDTYILHPDYNSATLENNIAVVHLAESVNSSVDNIAIVSRLSTDRLDSKIPKKDRCVMSSFGPDENGDQASRLQSLDVTVQDDSQCSNISNYVVDSNLCYTGDPGGVCTGDAGYPVACLVGRDWVLVGVHSVGSCTTGSQSASQVSFFKTWITRTVRSSSPISCGSPPTSANGTFTTNGTNIENDEATLICDAGFSLSSTTTSDATITCQSDGQWSLTEVVCLIDCDSLPGASNGSYEFINSVNRSALLTCDNGYVRSSAADSDATITCQSNGSWNSSDVTCVRSCGNVPGVINGTFATNGTNIVDDTATLECNDGFLRSTTNDSEASVTCQSDGSWSSTSATCIRSCGNVPDALNGTFATNGTNIVDDTATLECDDGFLRSTTNDSEASLICQLDGSWSSTSATCIRSCGNVPDAPNGTFATNGTNIVDDTATLECDNGFLRSTANDSEASIACQLDGSWSSTSATCIRSCGSVPDALNGTFATNGTNIVDDTATLECDNGFLRSTANDSEASIVCQLDGSWSLTSATCIRSCGNVPDALNGTFDTNGTNIVDDTATLECDDGFLRSTTNDSEASLICQMDGSWSSTSATCIRSCENVPDALNGTFATNGTNIVDDTATLECDNGFLRSTANDSEASITCQLDGSWSSTSATCIRSCGNVPDALNGTFATNGTNIVDDTATLECDVGFLRSTTNDSEASLICQMDGSWSSTSATCIRSCGNVPDALNGTFATNGTNIVDDTATLECDNGFLRSTANDSEASITCQLGGSWSSTSATCIRSCGNVPEALNGTFATNGTNIVDDTATLECDDGFLRSTTNDSEASLICQLDGSWSSTSATCIRSCGSVPDALNGTFATNGTNIVDDTATLECDNGFLRSTANDSESSIVCQLDGSWSSTSATCIRSCGNVPDALNGTFATNGTNIVDDTATLECDDGFLRSTTNDSEASLICQMDGSWSSTSATCIRSCGSVPDALNGTFATNGTNIVDDTATLECDNGFLRSTANDSEASIVCQLDGSWSLTSATCIRSCGNVPDALNGTFATNGTNIVDDTATLECDDGFLRSTTNDSEASLICQMDGSWSSTSATCIRSCGSVPDALNGTLVTNGTNIVDDTATLECDNGFLRSTANDSEASIVCQLDGSWSSTSATCIRSCGNVPDALNGTFATNGTNIVDDTAILECDDGFLRSTTNDSEASLICQMDGSWSSTSATCIRSCGNVPDALNGTFATNGTNIVDDTATLECDNGFLRSTANDSEASITCQLDGSWSSTSATCIRSCGSVPDALNGTLATNGTNIVDDTATLECDNGFLRSTANDSEASITCQLDGSWSSTSATCIRSCGNVPDALNGTFATNGTNIVDDTATLECDDGFLRSTTNDSEASLICQMDGSWSSTSATCIRSCGNVPAALNGTFATNGTNIVDDTATLECDNGFLRSTDDSEASITCQLDGSWSSTSATCIRSCGNVPEALNGTFATNGTNIIDDTATLECDDGFLRSTTNDSEASLVCQMDGSWSSTSATCIRSCGYVPDALNGTFATNGTNIVDDTATLECDDGFLRSTTNDSEASLICQMDGSWSSTSATCIRSCGNVPDALNGTFATNGTNIVDDTATLECDNGFLRSTANDSEASITCQLDGSWSSTSATCIRSCGNVPDALNGTFATNGTNIVDDTATLECDNGFLRSTANDSEASITCQLDGSWSSTSATCIRSCGNVPDALNGTFATNGTNIVDDTATLECDNGFLRSTANDSEASITCQLDGSWSSTSATCIRSCGNVPDALNGTFATNGTNIVDDTATLECDDGFLRSTTNDSEASLICQMDGSWSSTSATCIRSCGNVPDALNGTFATNGTNIVDDTATLECDNGFLRSTANDSEASIVCQLDGSWSSTSATCIRSCGSVPDALNGTFATNGTNIVDDTATLECDNGFLRSTANDSEASITCQLDGSWSSTSAACIRSCGNVPDALNGTFATNGTNIVDDTATLECDDGFLRSTTNDSEASFICQMDGSWSSTSATCIRSCGNVPDALNGTFATNGTNIVDDTATLECDNGFLRSTANDSEASITCQLDGSWSSTSATCIRSCGNVPEAHNGTFATNGTNIVDDTATLECDDGFLRSTTNDSEASLICQMDGSWSSTSATCIRSCGSVPDALNGTFATNGTNIVDDTATLECDNGFLRSTANDSESSIVCQLDGSWSSTSATCIRSCGNVPDALNGTFATNGTNIVDDTATLECDDGFLRSTTNDSEASLICQMDGSWSSTSATCIRSCGSVPDALNGTFASNGTNIVDDTATLECDNGFLMSTANDSEASIVCQLDGSWSSTSATCIRSCGNVPDALNGTFATNGTNIVDDTAILECDDGFLRSTTNDSEASLICQMDGSWSSTSATCIRSCGSVPDALNGTLVTNGTNIVDDTATLECDNGFLRSTANDSEASIVCQLDGSWSSTSATCIRSCGNVPDALNGTFATNGTNIVDDTATLECDDGFLRSTANDSEASLICQMDGSWSSTSATCIRSCGNVPDALNGTFATNGTNIVDDTATLECDNGFLRSTANDSEASITCQLDGSWSSTSTTCIRSCGNVPDALNGTFATNGTNIVDDTATLECDDGFLRSTTNDSEASLICQKDGSWTSTSATCIRSCGNVPDALNGTFATNGTNIVDDTATLECDDGFLRSTVNDSEASITCQLDGSWSSTSATCIRRCGSVPEALNGTFATNGTDIVDDIATLECDDGFLRSTANDSEASIICKVDGSWSSSSATCIRSCGNVPDALNGTFATNGTNIVDDTAILECDDGFRSSASSDSEALIICQLDGSWSSTSATCIRSCGNVPDALNGTFETNGTNIVDDTATLECDDGFLRSTTNDSEASITCQLDGSWSSTSAKCIKYCGQPPSTYNGTYTSNARDVVGDTAALTCDVGYTISSAALADTEIMCQEDGTWSTRNVTCEKQCGSRGTSFMFGYFQNLYETGRPFVYLQSDEPTEVTVEIPFYPAEVTFTLNRFARVSIDNRVTGMGDEELSNKGIHIYSEKPIGVHAHHYRRGNGPSAEGTLILPEACAKQEYLVISHNDSVLDSLKSQFMVIGLSDNTQVSIELPSGESKIIDLDRFGTYHYRETDLTGAIIKADSPVITLAGHTCANVPTDDTVRCDYIMEQMPPISSLKKAYIMSFMKPRPNFALRVVAVYDSTEVSINDENGSVLETVMLNKAESYFTSFYNSDTISVTANKNILVAQYGHGSSSDDLGFGDPSMIVIPGLRQYESSYNLQSPRRFYNKNYVLVVINSNDNISGLRLNADPVNTENSIDVTLPGYGEFKVLHIELFQALNTLSHIDSSVTFGAVQYGFNFRVEYSWMAGRVF